MPSQDQIVDGLSQFNDQDTSNMLMGHMQNMDLTHTVQKGGNGMGGGPPF